MCEYAYSDADLLITGAEQGLRPDRASVHHKGGVQQVRKRHKAAVSLICRAAVNSGEPILP